MAEVIWSPNAEQSLQDIRNFIARNNPATADRVVSNIRDRSQLLGEFPELGPRFYEGYEQYGQTGQHIRILRYRRYNIIYTVRLDGDIEIVGVHHGSRGRFPF